MVRNVLERNVADPEHAVILYGPPASGKDTVTAALHEADTRFVLFRRLKVGTGRTDTYRMIGAVELADRTARSDIIYLNHRYTATYAVDRSGILDCVDAKQIPVVHLGQTEGVHQVSWAIPRLVWTVVELWCPRPIAEQRIIARATGDTNARLEAWDATEHLADDLVDLRIDTSHISPAVAAATILAAVRGA